MERKVDELTEENGTLSDQVMTENQLCVLVYRVQGLLVNIFVLCVCVCVCVCVCAPVRW